MLEFSSEDPTIAYMPRWVMNNLLLDDGMQVNFKLVTLPTVQTPRVRLCTHQPDADTRPTPPHSWQVTSITFQPYDYALVEAMTTPKQIMEHALRGFTTITMGDDIVITYLGTLSTPSPSLPPPCLDNTSLTRRPPSIHTQASSTH